MANIVIVGALPESLLNFRGDLLKTLVHSGHEVTAMADGSNPTVSKTLVEMGVAFRSYPVQRNGMSIFKDLQTFWSLRKAFQELKPDVIFAYTIKPVVWGGLASRALSSVSFYALIEGLGFAFQVGNLRRKILGVFVSALYKISLSNASRVIFLNPDNRQVFLNRGLIRESKTASVDGIGLDLEWYDSSVLPDKGTVFLTIARLLGEKGLREFAQAATIVKQRYPEVEFRLVGQPDPSPDGIALPEVLQWESESGVKYLGSTDDVRPHLASCHIYVLPSYHEGMPRTVLEAMATGRPILTTDVPGCRETVTSGENGFLVPKADAHALAERMIWFIEHRNEWQRMGKNSRTLAEARFDVHKINRELMMIMGMENDPSKQV